MRITHIISLTALVVAAGLALGASKVSADSPTATQLMNATYPVNGFGNIRLTDGVYSSVNDPTAITIGGPYSMSFLTSMAGRWDGHDVSAVITQFTQGGATRSQLWLVDSTLRPFGGAMIEGNVVAAIPSFVDGQLAVTASIRDADGSLSTWNGIYDLVVGELKLVGPVAVPASSTPGAPETGTGAGTGAAAGTGTTTTAQVVPARAGNAGIVPDGSNLGFGLALAVALGGALVGARRLGRAA